MTPILAIYLIGIPLSWAILIIWKPWYEPADHSLCLAQAIIRPLSLAATLVEAFFK